MHYKQLNNIYGWEQTLLSYCYSRESNEFDGMDNIQNNHTKRCIGNFGNYSVWIMKEKE